MGSFLSSIALLPSSNPATWVRHTNDPGAYIAAPLLALLYYLLLFLFVHRPYQQEALIPQYSPPKNLSPAALRYLFTGDSDSKSLAAVLLQLASRGLISIKGHKDWFIITKLSDQIPPGLPPEELAALSVMFLHPEPVNALRIPDELVAPDLPVDAYPIQPFAGSNYNSLSIHIHRALRKAYESEYFTRHLAFTVPAAFLSIPTVIYTAFLPEAAFWISLVLVGTILLTHLTPLIYDFVYRRYRDPGNWAGVVALLIAGAAVMLGLASNLNEFHSAYLASLIVTLLLNIFAPGFLRVPKAAARALAPAIEGYREFLARVQIDPLHRLDHPEWTPGPETEHMAYAVALDLPGSWETYVASSQPIAPAPLTTSTDLPHVRSGEPDSPATSALVTTPDVSPSSIATAARVSTAVAYRLREIPTAGAQYRFVPAGEEAESESPLRHNWWRYAILLVTIAVVCSPMYDVDPASAFSTILIAAFVLAVLAWLFRRRD
ncbi:MAG: DUF2207 family protein [Candidatus Acidiferrales bacterium]